jgi:adenosine deaminase
MTTSSLSRDIITRMPKVLLHDHLDGGVRPSTILELAHEAGYTKLPTNDVAELATWFVVDDPDADLVRYLRGFAHTVAVMQTREQLMRIAAECALDLARDGVVYAEVRFAPELHTELGLSLDEVVEAVLEGFRMGTATAAREGHTIVVRTLLSAMRQAARSLEIAELAVRHRDAGVAGFDVAGPEKGFPPTQHLDAFQFVQRANFHITLHAGEAFGLPSIWEAIQYCNAERLGHGVRIVDDITWRDGEADLGRLASFVRDRRIPLELCPTSNVHTHAVASFDAHPIDLLRQLGFRVTLNTDNRLMSGITLSDEFASCAQSFGWDLATMEWVTTNAMKSAFYPFDERLDIIKNVIKPGYAALRATMA